MTDWTRTRAEIPGGVTTAQNATGNPAGGAVNNKPLSGNVGNPAGGAPVTSYTVCSSANNLSTVYISAAFAVTEMDGPAWSNAFTQFLAQNYAYQGAGVGCNNMTLNNAPTFLRNRVAALRAQKKQVVETGWTYGVSAALPVAIPPLPHQDQLASLAPARSPPIRPAPAAPTRASPQTTYAFCWGGLAGLTHVAYFGTPFEAPVRNVPAWSTAYKEFLRNKYKFAGVIHCGTLKSLDEAQQRAQQEEDAMQAHWKIIETGWKYE